MTSSINGGPLSMSRLHDIGFKPCPICKVSTSTPPVLLLLPCLHSACEYCINKYSEEHLESPGEGKLLCAECGEECMSSQATRNTFFESLQEFAACHTTSQDRACDYCSYDGTTSNGEESAAGNNQQGTAATSRCLECRDNLCTGCKLSHSRTKVTRTHPVPSFNDINSGKHDEEIRKNQHLFCDAHPQECVKYYCPKLDQLICRECKVSPQHDKHVCEDLQDAGGKYRSQSKSLLQKVDAKIPDLVEFSLFLKDYIEHLDETKVKLIADIEKQAEVLHQMVEDHKATMIQQVQAAAQKESDGIQERKLKVEQMSELLKSNTEFVDHLLQYGNDDEVLSVRKQVTSRLHQLRRLTAEPMVNKLSLYFNQGTATNGNMENLFGKVDIFTVPLNNLNVKAIFKSESPVLNGTNGKVNTHSIEPIIDLPSPTDLQSLGENVTEVACFEACGPSDEKGIWPTGVALNPDGHIVTLDRDNKMVKIFDQTGKFLREFGQNGLEKLQHPYDLTVMANGSIAVTDYEDEDVKVFTPDGRFLRSIKAGFKYLRGISTNHLNQLLVIDCHSHRLTIHDPDTGDVVQQVSGQSSDGCDFFTEPFYVCSNPQGHIIVTDWSAPNLRFFDERGNYLANYGSYGMNKNHVLQPYGICTDDHGNIFVADNSNHRILLLAPDGTFLRFVVSKEHGLWHPMAVTVDSTKGHLIVTEALGKVKIFKYTE